MSYPTDPAAFELTTSDSGLHRLERHSLDRVHLLADHPAVAIDAVEDRIAVLACRHDCDVGKASVQQHVAQLRFGVDMPVAVLVENRVDRIRHRRLRVARVPAEEFQVLDGRLPTRIEGYAREVFQ